MLQSTFFQAAGTLIDNPALNEEEGNGEVNDND